MKAPLFEYPSYQYQIKDWEFKKKGLLKRLKGENFIRTRLQTFETDRQTNNKNYLHYFQELIPPWQDPRQDTTSLAYPKDVKEGTLFISPSSTLHFVHPNQVRKHRTIISFDLQPELPEHQKINN